MNDNITVPKYGTVVGTHFNAYGQALKVPPNLSFVNHPYLRQGVKVLESLRSSRNTVALQEPKSIELIAQHFQIAVAAFQFETIELVQILTQIRSELLTRGQVFADATSKQKITKVKGSHEIVMLKPNFHGIGVDLRALWRKATRGRNED
jgi:hypothetical protein